MHAQLRLAALLVFSALLITGCVTNAPTQPTAAPSGTITSQAVATTQDSASAASTSISDYKTYDGEAYTIQYPQDWQLNEAQGITIFQTPLTGQNDTYQENVNVLIVPSEQDLNAFIEAALSQSVETAGFELIDSTATTLSGQPARTITYSEQSTEGKIQYAQTISVQSGHAIIVTYTALSSTFDEYRRAAEAMTASFKLKTTPGTQTPAAESSMAPQIVRKWRVYSQAIYYDAGAWNYLDTPATTLLEIRADQTWTFSTSTGTWSIQAIEESDWQKWGVPSYGPTRKLVLNGWNGETNDGPIEESESRVDFMWVIYRVGPPIVSSPGQIQMKFGQTYGG
ncbi:DcrB-related protein [Candidatus Micrarchaeota archaeon]|nr:DcrB-related protein [Candidatus Micrarchaeota archaeon]